MWIFILIVAFFVAQFFISKQIQSSKIAKQGGMLNKYRKLIDIILSWHPKTCIYENGSDHITIRTSSESGIIDIILVQNKYNLSVQWIVESSVFGKHKLKWEFYEFDDQKKMAQKINHDVAQYSKNITGNSDPISNHLGDFQDEFTQEQKAVMIFNLLMIAEVEGETQPAELQQIEYTAKLLGIELDDPIFHLIPARMFVEGVAESGPKYFSRILNSLSESQKEWFAVIIVGIITVGGIKNIEIRNNRALRILGSIGISEEE